MLAACCVSSHIHGLKKTGYATADGAQPVHVNGWMGLLFLGFVLLQFQLYEEGDEQSKSDAEGDDNPEVNAVMRHNTEQEVGEGSDAESNEDAGPAQGRILI